MKEITTSLNLAAQVAKQCERILGGKVLIRCRDTKTYTKRVAIIRYLRKSCNMTLREIGYGVGAAESLSKSVRRNGYQHHATIIHAMKPKKEAEEILITEYLKRLSEQIVVSRAMVLNMAQKCPHCGQRIGKRA